MSETKRKMLTPQERIAKAKAELEAAEAKARTAATARYDVLQGEQTKLITKRDELAKKLTAVQSEIQQITDAYPEIGTSAEVVDLPQSASAE